MTTSETSDRTTLKFNYANKHKTSSKTFEEAYSITFTDPKSNHSNLDYLESKWINLLQANININKTILPFYR